VVESAYWHRYLLSIRSPSPAETGPPDVEQIFRDAREGILDLDDGHIGPRRRPRGRYQFLTVDTVQNAFPAAEWLTVDHPEPQVGPVRGFFNVEWWTDDPQLRTADIDIWVGRSHGYLVDLSGGSVFDFIVRQRWPLREALDRYGFDDGDFFLSRRPEYFDPIRQILAAALTEAGVKPDFITYGTHHNPLLVRSFDYAAVEGRFVDLWGWNYALLEDPSFRRHVLNDLAADTGRSVVDVHQSHAP
jgi:hypothetical protein